MVEEVELFFLFLLSHHAGNREMSGGMGACDECWTVAPYKVL